VVENYLEKKVNTDNDIEQEYNNTVIEAKNSE
jgi:hypothetical protein